jgi:hypothetical protein
MIRALAILLAAMSVAQAETRIRAHSWHFVPGLSDWHGADVIEWSPGLSEAVPIWDVETSTWTLQPVPAPLTLSISDVTYSPAPVAAHATYDLYVWRDNGGFAFGRSPAWVGPDDRGTGPGSAERALQLGILVNKYAIANGPCARCGTWVGTARSNEFARIFDVIEWRAASMEASADPYRMIVGSMHGSLYTCCGRDYAGKVLRPPVDPTQRTAVIVNFGQSMGGNNSPTRYVARAGVDNFDPYTGQIFAAADPLLGPIVDELSERKGNFLTLLGDKLMARGKWDRVILVNLAVGGSQISWWADGALADRLPKAIARLHDAGLPVTAVLLGIGESDHQIKTAKADWMRSFNLVVDHARASGLPHDVPWFVAQESLLPSFGQRLISEDVRSAQRGVVDRRNNVHPGPDIDEIPQVHRMSHWSDSGADMSAEKWLQALEAYGPPFSSVLSSAQ